MPLRLRAWWVPTASYLRCGVHSSTIPFSREGNRGLCISAMFVEYVPHSKTCQQPEEHVLVLVNSGARAPTEPPSLV